MKKVLTVSLALMVIALFFCGCEDGPATGGCEGGPVGGGVCTENGGYVDGVEVPEATGIPATKLYYPCDLPKSDRKVGATTVTGGFWEVLEDVEWLSESIAEAGYVALAFTVDNNTGLIYGWKNSHLGAIKRLKQINADPSHKLYGKIDTSKLQTCGHSKGGGSSLWSASILGNQLRTAVGMAPWQEIQPAVDYHLENVTAATLIQAAALDSMAVPSMTRALYGNPIVPNRYNRDTGLPDSISRAYFEYNGLGHVAWYKAFPNAAEKFSSNIVAWMKYYLDGDTSYESELASCPDCAKYEWVR